MANAVLDFYVKQYENHDIKGYVKNPFEDVFYPVDNWMQFILVAEKIMDENNMPQATTQGRVFPGTVQSSEDGLKTAHIAEPVVDGMAFHFQIRIATRQNNCWQGAVTGDNMERAMFYSILELTDILKKQMQRE